MRALWRLSLGFALILSAIAPAPAFESGVWQGGPDKDETGQFIDCTMTAQSGSGILLAFIIGRDGDWGLALADERWELDVGAVEDIELSIDTLPPIKAIAKVVDRHGILVPLANDDSVVSAMRHGKLLDISTQAGTFSFELTGTSDALAALSACVAENLGVEKAQGAPGRGAERGQRKLGAAEATPSDGAR